MNDVGTVKNFLNLIHTETLGEAEKARYHLANSDIRHGSSP